MAASGSGPTRALALAPRPVRIVVDARRAAERRRARAARGSARHALDRDARRRPRQLPRRAVHAAQGRWPGSIVRALHEARDGAIWVGTDTGLSRIDAAGTRTYTTRDGLSLDVVFAHARGPRWRPVDWHLRRRASTASSTAGSRATPPRTACSTTSPTRCSRIAKARSGSRATRG